MSRLAVEHLEGGVVSRFLMCTDISESLESSPLDRWKACSGKLVLMDMRDGIMFLCF